MTRVAMRPPRREPLPSPPLLAVLAVLAVTDIVSAVSVFPRFARLPSRSSRLFLVAVVTSQPQKRLLGTTALPCCSLVGSGVSSSRLPNAEWLVCGVSSSPLACE